MNGFNAHLPPRLYATTAKLVPVRHATPIVIGRLHAPEQRKVAAKGAVQKRRDKHHQERPKSRRLPPRGHWLLWLGAILVVTFVVYLPSLDNGFLNWDDNQYVTENQAMAQPSLHDLLTVPLGGNYHPLTMLSLALNYRLSGLDPASYHWLNLLIHLANTALVFLFVRRLSGDRFWTTVVTSVFFGIHPTHVESVAWISERKDVLYAFFYLIALIVYLRYLDTRRAPWLILTLLAFVLSLASKPAAVVLPLTLLAIDYFRRRPWSASVVLEKAPFFAISVAAGILTLHAQRLAGATAAAQLFSPFKKVLFASYATAMYVVKLLVPVHLSAIYPHPPTSLKTLGPKFYVALAAVAILLPTVVYLCRRVRVVLFGLAFFFINIFLVLQLFTIGGSIMADRYTYLPYIGLFFALAWWLDEPPGAIGARLPVKPLIAGVLLLLFPFSLIQSWRRCDVWQNTETFWNDTIQKYPGQIVDAYNNRGYYYHSVNRINEALADYDVALALNSRVPRTWMNKGLVLAELGRRDSALICFNRALELQPDRTDALNNRGGIRLQKGDLAGAVDDFSRAIEIRADFYSSYVNRAIAYFAMGDYEKSIADRRRAIELRPNNPTNYRDVGAIAEALLRLNRPREAVAEYDRAIQGAPQGDGSLGGYYLNRSRAWWALHDRTKALSDAVEAQRLGAAVDPGYFRELGRTGEHP
jgi:tetratricopeptide (TPR) repeat protein